MSWYFFVARRGDRVVLIDVGTNALSRPSADIRSRWSIVRAVSIREALRRVDLTPREVTDVVLTHHHWDHVGALPLFDRARVHVHPGEWRSVARSLREPVEASGRLRPLREGGSIADGLRAYEGGKHTAHQLMVSLACAGGEVILAGDAAYLFQNIEDALPVTVTVDPQQNVADLGAAVRRAGLGRVIPGHDPEVFRRFPTEDPHVAAICP